MELSVIQSHIRSQIEQGRAIRRRITSSAGAERHALWNEKRDAGAHARVLFLLYGYLRRVPYQRIEAHCREGNEPLPRTIAQRAQALSIEVDAVSIDAWIHGSLRGHEADAAPGLPEVRS